jgi:hypothetical protein
LLGLKGDDNEDDAKNSESKQLNEDEAEQGMEMEGDFDGEMYDLPERPADDENEEAKDGEEELDREMGEDASPNEEVVDEGQCTERRNLRYSQSVQKPGKCHKVLESKTQHGRLKSRLRGSDGTKRGS